MMMVMMMMMMMILRRYLWCCHREKVTARVHPVHLTNVRQRQAAADPQTKPSDLGCESACRLHPSSPFIITQPER